MTATDLTTGNTQRILVKYAIPLVLSSLLQSTYSIVDMMIVGRFVGSAGISAVANGSYIINLLTSVITGLTMGGSVLIGQYYGSKNSENCRQACVTLYSLGIILGCFCTIVFSLLSKPVMSLMHAPSLSAAAQYLKLGAVGCFFISGYNACSAALRAVGNSKLPLYCIATSSVINIVLDLFFVGVFNWGVCGAAAATVIAQVASFFMALGFLYKDKNLFGIELFGIKINTKELKHILQIGFPCAVQWSVGSVSWLVVIYLVNDYGIDVSAGYGVAGKIREFCVLFTSAMMNAASAVIAQNIGANAYDRAYDTMRTAIKMSVLINALIIVIVELASPYLVAIFTQEPDAAFWAIKNLRIEILGQFFYAVFMMYHALAIGSGHTWFAFISSCVNCILARIMLSVLFNSICGIVGMYWACMIAPFSSVILGFWFVRSCRWKRKPLPNM